MYGPWTGTPAPRRPTSPADALSDSPLSDKDYSMISADDLEPTLIADSEYMSHPGDVFEFRHIKETEKPS
jgi:hypothetical protein